MTTLLNSDKVAISRSGLAYSATLSDIAAFSASASGGGSGGGSGGTSPGASARQPGDVFLSFDISPPSDSVELNGAILVDGALDYPIVAARYAFMVSGNDLILPDLRGQFIRGWDHSAGVDPDAASRTARAGDGAGGDLPGTLQPAELAAHSHDLYRHYTFAAGGSAPVTYPHDSPSALDTQTGAAGGSETRPMNIAMMFFMAMG